MPDNDDLVFDVERFASAPPADRPRLCRALGLRAQQLADEAEPQFRDAYAKMAQQWMELADEISTYMK